jgi:hypothetical protein
MAKAKAASSSKQTFGKRKQGPGSQQKSYNKHTPRPKTYRGQGRA